MRSPRTLVAATTVVLAIVAGCLIPPTQAEVMLAYCRDSPGAISMLAGERGVSEPLSAVEVREGAMDDLPSEDPGPVFDAYQAAWLVEDREAYEQLCAIHWEQSH